MAACWLCLCVHEFIMHGCNVLAKLSWYMAVTVCDDNLAIRYLTAVFIRGSLVKNLCFFMQNISCYHMLMRGLATHSSGYKPQPVTDLEFYKSGPTHAF